MHIPSTGDEGPYLQITRLTAAYRMPEKDIARVLQEQCMGLLFRQELLLQGAQP